MAKFRREFYFIQKGTRNQVRSRVVNKFLSEKPGTGRGEKATNYRYDVEKLEDGRKVYLTRPAYKRVGFDFLIHVEEEIFKNGKDNPEHDDILEDLRNKKKENSQAYKKLHEALTGVYECEDPKNILEDCRNLYFKSGRSIELILKVVKWFFIEQDIRYWNYSGRGMLKKEIDKILQPRFGEDF